MKKSILAARRAWALQAIEEKSGIDLSRAALRKAPSVEIFQLFQLERLAEEMTSCAHEPQPQVQADLAVILEVLEHTKGVGPKLLETIKEELADVVPEATDSA
jgi:hypothetical protein